MGEGEETGQREQSRFAEGGRRALLGVETSEEEGVPLIRVAGEVDLSTADVLREAIENASQSHPEEIVLDMSGVRFMDSTGVNVLLTAGARVNLVLRAPSRAVQLLVDVVGLTAVVSIEPQQTRS